MGNNAGRFYSSGNRIYVRSEDTDNVAEFASYGLYLPRDVSTGLYCTGGARFNYADAGDEVYIENGTGEVGIGTTAPDDKLDVVGNAQVSGYLRVGNPTSGSTTRHEMKEFYWTGHQHCDDTYRKWSIGTIPIPSGATSITVRNIYCDFDGYHEDGNEGYGARIYVGSSYIGMTENNVNGFVDVDWNFNSEETGLSWNFTTAPTVYAYVDDHGGSWGDEIHALNFKVQVYYDYTVGLRTGDIAASGRVYANNTYSVGDLAEHFDVNGAYEPGMVVSYELGSDDKYALSDRPYDPYVAGVISENPSVVINSPEEGPPVALTGRVDVKVVPSDRLIRGGDFLTTSEIPGRAKLAKKPGPIIGYAVNDQKEGNDFVRVLLQLGRYIPGKAIGQKVIEENEIESGSINRNMYNKREETGVLGVDDEGEIIRQPSKKLIIFGPD
ncbi:hypothetical protein DRQ36_04840 [bacterium]|nr:MAG: hypothetical protein DRQ36_04840 [bacterium]